MLADMSARAEVLFSYLVQPIVDMVGYVQTGKLIKQSGVPNGVKCFAEVQG